MAFFDGWGRDVVTRRAEVLTRAVAAADVAGLIARGVIGTFSKPSSLFCRLSPTGDTRFANSPKRSMGHVLGAKKGIFQIRGRGRLTVFGGRAGSCQSLPKRSPWGRLGSVLDTCNRLRRTRGDFHRCTHISKVLCALWLWTMILQNFGSRALWRAPSTAACGVGDYPTPDLSRRESGSRSASEKSVQFGPDGAPFP